MMAIKANTNARSSPWNLHSLPINNRTRLLAENIKALMHGLYLKQLTSPKYVWHVLDFYFSFYFTVKKYSKKAGLLAHWILHQLFCSHYFQIFPILPSALSPKVNPDSISHYMQALYSDPLTSQPACLQVMDEILLWPPRIVQTTYRIEPES